MEGAVVVCRTLVRLGATAVFGVPGTQNIDLWDALGREERPTLVGATSELGAAFMANGYGRACGRPGVVLTIPGPGFAYALPGLAEALADSTPLIHVVGAPPTRRSGGPTGQWLEQRQIGRHLAKAFFAVERAPDIASTLHEAFVTALSGEPGPVIVELDERVLRERVADQPVDRPEPEVPGTTDDDLAEAARRLAGAKRPLLLVGQGAADAAEALGALVEELHAPVITTTSGRGVLPERHPWCIRFDSPGAPVAAVNALVEECDLIVVVGAKLSDNATYGSLLRLPGHRVVRVDASADVLATADETSLRIHADAGVFLAGMIERVETAESTWTALELAAHRDRILASAAVPNDPKLAGDDAARVLGALRRSLPDDGVVTTDSGLHQFLVRRHVEAPAPRTLLVPSDFQSMGFGIPAAIGAAVATSRPAVAVVGDGGLAISGLELATAVSHGLPVAAVVLVDRAFGLIRRQQLRRTGRATGIDLATLDIPALATAVGARHDVIHRDNVDQVLADAFRFGHVPMIEIGMDDTRGAAQARRLGTARTAAQTLLGPAASSSLADAVRRRRS